MCARVCLCACVWGVMWRLIFYVVWCYDFLMCGVLVYMYIYIFLLLLVCAAKRLRLHLFFYTFIIFSAVLLFLLHFYVFSTLLFFFLCFYFVFCTFVLLFFTFVFVKPSINCRMRQWLFALLVCFYVYLLCGKLWQQAVVFYVILIKFGGYQTPFFMHFLCTADFWFFFLLFLFLLRQITLHNFNGASVWQQRARYFHASKCFRINFARCSCCWRSQQNICAIFTFSGANNFRIYFRFSLTFSTSCFFQIIYLF